MDSDKKDSLLYPPITIPLKSFTKRNKLAEYSFIELNKLF